MKLLTAKQANELVQYSTTGAVKRELAHVMGLIKWACRKGYFKVTPIDGMFTETRKTLEQLGYKVENNVIRWENIN